MTQLARFQKATVDAAMIRFTGTGTRRFLVADEVGLGKTIIARAIAERLAEGRKTMNVMYLCPSLEIVGQNRAKFVALTGIDEHDYKSGGDRLALVAGSPPEIGNGYRIFAFTPETSLPGWKPGPRTGRKAERAKIRKILTRYPALRKIVLAADKNREEQYLRRLLDQKAEGLDGYTWKGIEAALRTVFSISKGNVEKGMIEWFTASSNDLMEFIARFRSALALAALKSKTVRPDLVILDEFHRYADLILPQPPRDDRRLTAERATVHRALVDALLAGEDPPAVLLLSATPYRLRQLSGDEVHPADHYKGLIDLAGFLANDPAYRDEVEHGMRNYHNALSIRGSADQVRKAVVRAKTSLEALLRPIIARTERALVHEEDLFDRSDLPVETKSGDLRNFRHYAVNAGKEFAGWTPAMWSSIPYPAQTLHAYKMWEQLEKADPAPFEAGSGRRVFDHPQLRLLQDIVGGKAALSLPWQPPTLPWWRLGGIWAGATPSTGKTLLFSRWRGAPTAISALLSTNITGGIAHGARKAPYLRTSGSDNSALVALFMPWPRLSSAVDPAQGGNTVSQVKQNARQQLAQFLSQHGIQIRGKGKRPVWMLAAGIERKLCVNTFRLVTKFAIEADGGAKSVDWNEIQPVKAMSRKELHALADHLSSAPGAIMARCLGRHGFDGRVSKTAEATFALSWGRLRPYLGNRIFAQLILSRTKVTRYPPALCDALLKGGFEAVIDEQISLITELGDAKGTEVIKQLSDCLLDRPGSVRLRHGGRDHRVPVQAAVPFAGGEQRRTRDNRSGKLRSDTLRRAFNSPFWPHLLCTTSIGQEGLDFHLWCSRIVHWDLPTDPVDFEQREGRIARYGSLAVRRDIAAKFATASRFTDSPFADLLSKARSQGSGRTGMERWWLPETTKPVSISFDWKFSMRSVRRDKMLKDLLYYRLALGQPDPDAFVVMLNRIDADRSEARSLAINLSAIT